MTTDDTASEYVDSISLLEDPIALRERAATDGYLFFRQLLPAVDVLRLRADLLAVVERYGWRRTGQDALGGAIDFDQLNRVPDEQMRTDIGVSGPAYKDAQRLESMHRLPHHPRLIELYRALFGNDVLVHARHIVRMITGHRSMHRRRLIRISRSSRARATPGPAGSPSATVRARWAG